MARNCCWNCRYYIARGDNEPAILGGATSNVCTFYERKDYDEDPKSKSKNWEKYACPTPAGYVCSHYKERFY